MFGDHARGFLLKIFGPRVALLFGGLSLIFAAALVSLYLTAGYAVQGYVQDQLGRLPWDISAGQRDVIRDYPMFQKQLRALPGAKRVEAFGLLRVANTGTPIRVEIDGRAIKAQWLVVVASSAPELLPPELQAGPDVAGSGRFRAVSLGLPVDGPMAEHLNAGKLALRRTGQTNEADPSKGDDDDGMVGLATSAPDILFEANIQQPVELQREEFNRWLLRNVGSTSYLPDHSVVIAVPMNQFAAVSTVFERAFGSSAGLHGGTAAPPFIPELTHLVRLDRERLIDPWLLEPSAQAVAAVESDVLAKLQDVTIFSAVSSDTDATLVRMSQVNHLIGFVTLLVAIPLLWLGWTVSTMLASLLLMNERRLIGLALIRGVPAESISQALLTALVAGGLVGGILGVLAGTGLTIFFETLAGAPMPPASTIFTGIGYFALFAILGVVMTTLAARGMIRRVRRMTPREAIAYVASNDVDAGSDRVSRPYLVAAIIALVLGSAKLIDWLGGWSPFAALAAVAPAPIAVMLAILSGVLNFVAVPLFLFGVAGLLRTRSRWILYVMSVVTAPIAGRLRWFVAEHMAIHRARVASTMFVSALAMALALLPQVAADSFYDRLLRGVAVSVGGDVQLQYGMENLAPGGSASTLTVPERAALIAGRSGQIERALRADPRVKSVAVLDELIAPDVYLPNQNGLMIDLIRSADDYLKTVDYEQGIGLTRNFEEAIRGTGDATLTASAGFTRLREVPLGPQIELGLDKDHPVGARFRDVVAFLPGQPSLDVTQREGYAAAEVDYINYLLGSDARAVSSPATFSRPPLDRLRLQPSRTVFLVRVWGGADDKTVASLVGRLPIKPQAVRWQEEERRHLSRDMFISLALANLKVFMIGGLVLAVAGVSIVGLANFLAERRTFALLRVRGLPVSALVRVSLSISLAPVAAGVLVGVLLGLVAGYGLSIAVWQLPRIYGVAGLLNGRLAVSSTSAGIIAIFGAILLIVSLSFALWPFRRTANENIRKS